MPPAATACPPLLCFRLQPCICVTCCHLLCGVTCLAALLTLPVAAAESTSQDWEAWEGINVADLDDVTEVRSHRCALPLPFAHNWHSGVLASSGGQRMAAADRIWLRAAACCSPGGCCRHVVLRVQLWRA